MFLVSAILPYSHLAIVFKRMFVKLMYLYRRFGLVDAGQRPSEGSITVGTEWGSLQLSFPLVMGFLSVASQLVSRAVERN